jgi:hypothetical protein
MRLDLTPETVTCTLACDDAPEAERLVWTLRPLTAPELDAARAEAGPVPVRGRKVLDLDLEDFLTAGTIGEAVASAAAQAGLHVREDALAYDANDRPTSIRRRLFPDAATLAASTEGGTGEGEIATWLITATHYDAVRWKSQKRTRV